MLDSFFEIQSISNFLIEYESKNTQITYGRLLKRYFNWLEINPDDYIKSKRDFEKDIKEFERYNTEEEKAPCSRDTMIVAIRQFLEHHDIIISPRFFKILKRRRKSNKPLTVDKIPTNSELKQILQYSDIRMRAVALTKSSSGMRIGELCDINWDMIDFDTRKVDIPSYVSKNGVYRYTFITPEAKDALLAWKKVYHKYLERAMNKTEKCLDKVKVRDDRKVFPYNHSTIQRSWHILLKKAGLDQRDPKTKRYVYHLHTLRKYFNTKLQSAGVPEGIVEKLMGHTGYLNGSYDRFSEEEVKKYYDENYKVLSVFSDLHKIDEYVEPRLQEQDGVISSMARENMRLKDHIGIVESEKNEELDLLKRQMDGMQQALKRITDTMGEELTGRMERKETQKAWENETPVHIKDSAKTKKAMEEIERIGLDAWRKNKLRENSS